MKYFIKLIIKNIIDRVIAILYGMYLCSKFVVRTWNKKDTIYLIEGGMVVMFFYGLILMAAIWS